MFELYFFIWTECQITSIQVFITLCFCRYILKNHILSSNVNIGLLFYFIFREWKIALLCPLNQFSAYERSTFLDFPSISWLNLWTLSTSECLQPYNSPPHEACTLSFKILRDWVCEYSIGLISTQLYRNKFLKQQFMEVAPRKHSWGRNNLPLNCGPLGLVQLHSEQSPVFRVKSGLKINDLLLQLLCQGSLYSKTNWIVFSTIETPGNIRGAWEYIIHQFHPKYSFFLHRDHISSWEWPSEWPKCNICSFLVTDLYELHILTLFLDLRIEKCGHRDSKVHIFVKVYKWKPSVALKNEIAFRSQPRKILTSASLCRYGETVMVSMLAWLHVPLKAHNPEPQV